VALVGEACGGRDFSQAMATVAHQLKRALQAQMHDVAVRRHADRSRKDTCEVKRAATGDLGQLTSLMPDAVISAILFCGLHVEHRFKLAMRIAG
jgi:DUF1009 family protein